MSQRPYFRSSALLALIALAITLSGCGGSPFALINEGHTMKPGSIAVISGVNGPSANKLAESITDVLAEKNTFRVMGQEEIVRRVPNCPVTID